jgi:hypothetical protein
MSTTHAATQNGTDCNRPIDHTRFVRALTEEMTVTVIAPNMVRVTHDGEHYDGDLINAVCECPDCQYRNVICKHLLRAAVGMIYSAGITTRFVAQVACHASEHPCPAGNEHVCDGPTGPGLPCQECINATGADEYTVWQQTAHRTGARR